MIVQVPRENPLHLLRALLRECTYLPDHAARTYWHSYTINRFREYCPRKAYTSKLFDKKRQNSLFRQARKGLRVLQRANAGHLDNLEKILLHTYGRTGRRRHELLSALEGSDVPEDQEAVSQLSESIARDRTKKYEFSDSVATLIRAQRSQPAKALSRIRIKSLHAQIPETNIWDRPMPQKRVINLQRKWYNKTLDRVLPPLPLDEWERLRGLSQGSLIWEGPVRRRGNLRPPPGRVMRRWNASNPHNLTPRFMRRIWEKIFIQCSTMSWNPAKSKWVVTWGKAERPYMQTHIGESDPMFEGVDDDGHPLGDGERTA